MEIPNVNTARSLVKIATTFENLAEKAGELIVIAATNGAKTVDIPYDNVQDDVHTLFHVKIMHLGYAGGKRQVGGRLVYTVRW